MGFKIKRTLRVEVMSGGGRRVYWALIVVRFWLLKEWSLEGFKKRA